MRSALRENKLIGILLDQNVDWYEGVYVPFFDQWACTNKGLALIAGITGTPSPTGILRPSTCCAKFALDTQGQLPLYSHPSEASSYHLTSPTIEDLLLGNGRMTPGKSVKKAKETFSTVSIQFYRATGKNAGYEITRLLTGLSHRALLP